MVNEDEVKKNGIADFFIFVRYLIIKKPISLIKQFWFGSKSTLEQMNNMKTILKALFILFLISISYGINRITFGIAGLIILAYLRWLWVSGDWKGEYRQEKYDKLIQRAKGGE